MGDDHRVDRRTGGYSHDQQIKRDRVRPLTPAILLDFNEKEASFFDVPVFDDRHFEKCSYSFDKIDSTIHTFSGSKSYAILDVLF